MHVLCLHMCLHMCLHACVFICSGPRAGINQVRLVPYRGLYSAACREGSSPSPACLLPLRHALSLARLSHGCVCRTPIDCALTHTRYPPTLTPSPTHTHPHTHTHTAPLARPPTHIPRPPTSTRGPFSPRSRRVSQNDGFAGGNQFSYNLIFNTVCVGSQSHLWRCLLLCPHVTVASARSNALSTSAVAWRWGPLARSCAVRRHT